MIFHGGNYEGLSWVPWREKKGGTSKSRRTKQCQIERFKFASKLSSKLVLVERGNPTYNFVRLQEGKLRGRDTNTRIRTTASSQQGWITWTALLRRDIQSRTKNRTRGCEPQLVRVDAHASARIPRRGAKSDQCESHWKCNCAGGCNCKQWAVYSEGWRERCSSLAREREKAASVYTFRNLKRRDRFCNSERCRYSAGIEAFTKGQITFH